MEEEKEGEAGAWRDWEGLLAPSSVVVQSYGHTQCPDTSLPTRRNSSPSEAPGGVEVAQTGVEAGPCQVS